MVAMFHPKGQVLVQISDTQRHLNSDLEGVVQVFNRDLLRAMEKNVNLDQQFVNGSKQRYESEYQQRMMALEKQKNELWRTERKKERNVREMQEMVGSLQSQLQMFLSESYRAVQVEEMRRYRFLAEKHSFLSYNFLQFYSRAKAGLQNRIPSWREQTEMSRNALNSAAGMLSTSQSPGYSSGRLTPVTKSFDKGSVEDLRTELRRSSSSIPQAMDEERRELDSGTRRRAPSVGRAGSQLLMSGVWEGKPTTKTSRQDSEDAVPPVDYTHSSRRPQEHTPSRPESRGLAMPTSQSRRSSVASTAPSSATSESRKSYGSENPPELFPR
nr:PREDICTED: brain-specific angiogenesis inhibitor 1-associated protein 2-like protein 2 [Latimeria chalumnae]|eukprot:XP_014347475.1 PREDICTED: brain-specific angiogenesis inhibitor 1-associated protein 2-like protein 2 [Latimeria chalumnae]